MPTKIIPVDQAVGMVLPHDITEIRTAGADNGAFKGTAFKKGHIIRPEDVEHLRRLGKERIYILTLDENEIHENEAAQLMSEAMAGEGVVGSGRPTEGKISLVAVHDGLLKINTEALYRFNLLGEVMCATLHDNTPVSKGEQVAATRLIPLISERQIVEKAVAIAMDAGGLLQVKQMRAAKAGLVITGSEVFYGRIKDSFEPVLREKLEKLGSKVVKVGFAPDDAELIAAEITACLEAGADLIITSGGMSVDPDDVTRAGIMKAGATDVCYGTPVLPGAMFLTGGIGEVPVLGLPACGMFHRITVFDLILPRVLCGETITREDLARMGHGGLCRNCKKCQYPVCGFGK
ncbi:MAG: molybdopterin-binding protein [Proteobacteria bacterium]|nr:molybdopterin-binding protein [Pseudomonadota bacterium]MBU4295608.1 molybdopterin-binding protein [Pseudomonadota bacterium]MCG2746799.1 molybdopterin-binding protein [Desulfobulbaceae bacterium]